MSPEPIDSPPPPEPPGTPTGPAAADRGRLPVLSALEARVLGVLVEKEHTVPDTYPLSLNALTAGCNQKSSRDPLMSASEAEVGEALDRLRSLSLVVETSGGRVMRYSHNVGRVLQVPSAAVALLATLMLRGPQTAGEIRINSERLHRFADISAVEGYLHELAAHAAGALVAELPRQHGSRENRWMHLLAGTPPPPAAPDAAGPARDRAAGSRDVQECDASPGRLEALEARVTQLADEVAELRAEVDRLARGGD